MKFEDLPNYRWHGVYCRPQFELDTAYKLGRLGVRYIVPAEKRWYESRKGSLKRERAVAKFPQYVFAGFDHVPIWEPLRERIPNIWGYMTFGHGPVTFALEDVQWLFRYRDKLLGMEPPKPFAETIKPGDKVKIARGPLAGMVLTVDEADAKKVHRFRELLGSMRVANILLADLAPAE